MTVITLDCICYDDACHLARFARNPCRAELTPQTRQLASVKMSVDRMHMRGHIDKWCKQNCDPATTPELNNVDCIILNMHYSVIMIHLSQCRLTRKFVNKFFLGFLNIKKLHKKWEKTFSYSFYFTFVICTTCMRKKSSRAADLCKM